MTSTATYEDGTTFLTSTDDRDQGGCAEGVDTFQPRKHADSASATGLGGVSSAQTMPPWQVERLRVLASVLVLQPPELSLDEAAHAQQCFRAVMGEKESITTPLELRVVLGELGHYPAESELDMVLEAYRGKVNSAALSRYLRFCKKEFAMQLQQQQSHKSTTSANGGGRLGRTSAGPNLTAAAGAAQGGAGKSMPSAQPGVGGEFQAFGSRAGLGDADTLRAFVALGGNEDGTGEVTTSVLCDVVREFGLTIDMDAMIDAVDVHHAGVLDYADFHALWSAQEEGLRRSSLCSFSSLNADTPLCDVAVGTAAAGGYPLMASTAGGGGVPVDLLSSSGAARGGNAGANRLVEVTSGNGGGYWKAASGNAAASAGAGGSTKTRGTTRFSTVLTGEDRRGPAGNAASTMNVSGVMGGVRRVNGGTAAMASGGDGGSDTLALTAAPITEEEHIQLLAMYLFPERYESFQRTRGGGGAGQSGAGGSGERSGGAGAGVRLPPLMGYAGPALSRRTSQLRMAARGADALSHSVGGGVGGGGTSSSAAFSRSAGAPNGKAGATSTSMKRGSRKKGATFGKGRGGSGKRKDGFGSHHQDEDSDGEVDVLSQKNAGVYQPPSPLILSLRNSTRRNRQTGTFGEHSTGGLGQSQTPRPLSSGARSGTFNRTG